MKKSSKAVNAVIAVKAMTSLLLLTALSGQASAQTDASEVASGLFLSRYVATVTHLSDEKPNADEIRVMAPQVRPADEWLESISNDLDSTLESQLEESLIETSR